VDVQLYVIEVLLCISLATSEIEHLFLHLLATLTFFFAKCFFNSFAHFKLGHLLLLFDVVII